MKKDIILVLGGYGGNNVGDDAQLEGALNDLNSIIPEALNIVLTPNLEQTMQKHFPESIAYAPRVSFFDFDIDPYKYIQFWKKENRKWLLDRFSFIIKNVKLRIKGKSHNLSKKQIQLIDLIATSRLIYYAGGGYIMGPTASRLWDAALVCQVATLYNTPVVMSGQNMGVWQTEVNENIAKQSFCDIKLIGTRDGTFSKSELEKVGVLSNKIMTTHDDALYIESASDKVKNYILKRIGLKDLKKPYISLSFHKPEGIVEIVKIVRQFSSLPIVIIPTCPPDKVPQQVIYKKLQELHIKDIFIVKKLHNHSEVKALISSAYFCISSRHHPVIFALSNCIPAISLNYSEYFSEKNYGALSLCGVGHLSLNINEEYKEKFNELFRFAINHRDELSAAIEKSHKDIKISKKIFLNRVREIWDHTY